MSTEADTAELARLRADLERVDVLYRRSCEVENALRAEVERMTAVLYHRVCEVEHKLRAEVERLKEQLRIESASAQHALAAAERAEADSARLDWLLDRSAQTYHSYSHPLGGGNYVQYHKDRADIDAAMKEEIK